MREHIIHGPDWSLPPDMTGPAGRAWRIRVELAKDPRATVGAWLVNVPGAHLLWAWWQVSVVHLRLMAGCGEAKITLPGATHELLVLALNPDHPPNDPRDPERQIRYLAPIDVVQQFKVRNDADALDVGQLGVRACCDGLFSPDSDYRSAWERHVLATAEHLREGKHGRPS